MERYQRDLISSFLTASAALLAFGWLANRVFAHQIIWFDATIRDWIHSFASPGWTRFFRVVTEFGSERFLVPLAAFAVWRLVAAGRRRAAILFTVAAAGGEALDFILKLVFRRTRPAVFFGLTAPGSYSFPSGHSMLSACLFGVLAAIVAVRIASRAWRGAVWAAAVAGTLAIGLSRIYLGVHYPSDVVAGYAAAIIWVASVRVGYEVWLRRARANGASLKTAPDTAGPAHTPPETLRSPTNPDVPA